MTKTTSESSSARTTVPSGRPGWSLGVFSEKGTQVPEACLRHCLDGDPGKAATHGCALLRQLSRPEQQPAATDGSECRKAAPAVCGQGYAVSVRRSDGIGSPSVLVLRSPQMPAAESRDQASAMIQAGAAENWRLTQENNALADEVLRSYEQINLIFDISAQIAILNDADEVRRMVLKKLRHMFNADTVLYVSGDESMFKQVDGTGTVVKWKARPGQTGQASPTEDIHRAGVDVPPEYAEARQRLRVAPRVFVFSAETTGARAGHGTSMWGPLHEDDQGCSVVGVIRRGKAFESGDMLLLDSTLTFSSHILSNLRLVEQIKRTNFETVRALINAIDQKDNYTYGHSERVGFLAKAVGRHMGLSPRQLQELEWAGMLHDIGKIGIPERVLNKPGRLTPDEFAIIKEHPSRSHEVLKPIATLEPILAGVLHHHENPDGTGYPAGLKGDAIPLSARIIHVVDVFDALTSTRSYRGAYDVDRALEILRNDAGSKLDSRIVEEFLCTWAELPQTHPEQYERWFGTTEEPQT